MVKPIKIFKMFSSSAFHGLKYQGRCLAAQLGETERHRFFVGTHNVRENNEVHLLEYDEDVSEVLTKAVMSHPREIESLSPHPTDHRLLFTCHQKGGSYGATLFRIPDFSVNDDDDEDDEVADGGADMNHHAEHDHNPPEAPMSPRSAHSMTELLTLDDSSSSSSPQSIHKVVWDSYEGADGRVASLGKESIGLWNFEDAACSVVKEPEWMTDELPELTAACFDPHHSNQFVSVNGSSIRCWDFRSMKQTDSIENAHSHRIRDIDYNPNKPFHVVTCGEDRRIKFFDLRKSKSPLMTLSGHSHWAWQVKYNRFHDQLVISSGTDTAVKLWSIVSISSAPLGELEEHDSSVDTDQLIGTLSDHEESVYALEWSACDAWVFASMSYDGRLVISQVPSAEKYKILL